MADSGVCREVSHTVPVGTRIGILDDHRSFGEAMCLALASAPGLECVGVTTDLDRCKEMLATLRPDLLIMDYQLVNTTGIECASALRAEGFAVRMVMLTAHAFSSDLQAVARRNGVEQVLSKDAPLSAILAAINSGPPDFDAMSSTVHPPVFSPRQREVLDLMGDGLSPAEIADALVVSIHTARRHVKDVMSLLGASTQLSAVAIAFREGHLIPSKTARNQDPKPGDRPIG